MSPSTNAENLLKLNNDNELDFLVIHERGITYEVPAPFIASLKNSYARYPSVNSWYDSLDAEKKQIVSRRDLINEIFPINDAGFMVQ
ncbi:MAG TPA: hypothetical protein VEV83_19440 [Parafilimonas sp.]|nr:hypothetical protein [Parafilimonas sp.]